MSASADPDLFTRALDWFAAHKLHDSAVAPLSRDFLRRLAADIGVSEADLREIVPQFGDRSDLMDRMMRARGLDPAAVRHAFTNLVRHMTLACARCRDTGTCYRELEAGTADARCHAFCVNAGAIDDLLERRA